MGSIVNYLQSAMLIERLVGVSVYALVLGCFYNKIQHAKSSQAISKYMNHYLVILCIMAFFYIPGTHSDLYRWRVLAEPWKGASFSWFWNNRVLPSRTPLGYLLIYACQMTGVNGLLPMVCAFGYFANLFHIIKCEAKRKDRTSDSIAVMLLFIMSAGTFLEVISGIRCMLAFSIVMRCVYDEMYLEKNFLKNIPFYLIAALLHSAAIPLIGVRLVCMIFEKRRKAILTVFNIAFALASFYAAIKLGNDYIESTFIKANAYVSRDSYSYGWEYIIAIVGLLVLVLILFDFKRKYPREWINEEAALRYLIIILVGEVFFVGTYSIFHRFFTVAVIVSTPILLTYLNCEHAESRFKSRQILVIFSMLILFLACIRGNLCGYKFFLLN